METRPTSSNTANELIARPLPPAPDVPADELAARLQNIRREMNADELDAIVLTDRKNIQYFTDFRSYSWYFNSRPFFVLITNNDLILFGATYERAHVDWKPRAFSGLYYDGYFEEGVACVASAVRDRFKGSNPRIAIDYGEEMAGRGLLPLIDALRALSARGELKTASPTLWR